MTRYSVMWGGDEFVRYGAWVANPRDPKYFSGRRLLVREITNPSIFCGFTQDELYNDPSVIIIKENETCDFPLMALLAILNSKLATFYHFNSSPKATKGAFPKILVGDISGFPLPLEPDAADLAKLTSLAVMRHSLGGSDQSKAVELDEYIDKIVLKLYGCSESVVDTIKAFR